MNSTTKEHRLKTPRLKQLAVGIATAAALAGCATAPESRPLSAAPPVAPAKAVCAAPPAELVVKDIRDGTGKVVRFRSAVTVGYTGWLYDGCKGDFKGAMFDTSEGRGMPFGFTVGAGRVIRGWDEGLIGMREKGKRLLIIPAAKAYGSRAMGDKIPANSVLVFEIDLDQILAQPPES
jgi:FKBP-type peptidyl-prolyl cis-trans isomerase